MPISTSPRADARGFPIAQASFYGDLEKVLEEQDIKSVLYELIEWNRSIVAVLNNAMLGKINVVGTVTLTASTTTTTISLPRISRNTVVLYTPTTANASAEVGNGTIFQTYPNTTTGQAVLNHASNAQVDRTFAFALLG